MKKKKISDMIENLFIVAILFLSLFPVTYYQGKKCALLALIKLFYDLSVLYKVLVWVQICIIINFSIMLLVHILQKKNSNIILCLGCIECVSVVAINYSIYSENIRKGIEETNSPISFWTLVRIFLILLLFINHTSGDQLWNKK